MENRKSIESSSGNNSSLYNNNLSRNFAENPSNLHMPFGSSENIDSHKNQIQNKSTDLIRVSGSNPNNSGPKESIGVQKLGLNVQEDWGFIDGKEDAGSYNEDFEDSEIDPYVPSGIDYNAKKSMSNSRYDMKLNLPIGNGLGLALGATPKNGPVGSGSGLGYGEGKWASGSKGCLGDTDQFGGTQDYQYSKGGESHLLLPVSSNFELSKNTEDLALLYGGGKEARPDQGWMRGTEDKKVVKEEVKKKEAGESYDDPFELEMDASDDFWDNL